MSSPTKLSVLIPLYNAECYIEECLERLRLQNIADLEILIVDDCSTDSSVQIVEEYVKKHPQLAIELVLSAVNQGPSSVRNRALELATGHFVCFVDSDDLVPLGALRAMLELADKNQSDIVVGAISRFREVDGHIEKTRYIGLEQQAVYLCEITASLPDIPRIVYSVSCSAKLYRRSFLQAIGLRFNTLFRYAEDHYFVIEALTSATTITIFPDVAYEYRIDSEGSAMKNISSEYFECIRQVLPRNLNLLSGWSRYYYARRVLDYELLQNVPRIIDMPYKEARHTFFLLRELVQSIDRKVRREFVKESPRFRFDYRELMLGQFHTCLARHHLARQWNQRFVNDKGPNHSSGEG